jgi:hypothetical protein
VVCAVARTGEFLSFRAGWALHKTEKYPSFPTVDTELITTTSFESQIAGGRDLIPTAEDLKHRGK